MTILEEDLKLIKTMFMQKRGAYHISENDKVKLQEALNRVNAEAQGVLE